jgi:hypothetical protein
LTCTDGQSEAVLHHICTTTSLQVRAPHSISEENRRVTTATNPNPTEAAFDAAVSTWDEPARCQYKRSHGRPCRLLARWHATDRHAHQHGEQNLVCTLHKTRFLRFCVSEIAHFSYYRCRQCGRKSTTPDQVGTYRPA